MFPLLSLPSAQGVKLALLTLHTVWIMNTYCSHPKSVLLVSLSHQHIGTKPVSKIPRKSQCLNTHCPPPSPHTHHPWVPQLLASCWATLLPALGSSHTGILKVPPRQATSIPWPLLVPLLPTGHGHFSCFLTCTSSYHVGFSLNSTSQESFSNHPPEGHTSFAPTSAVCFFPPST